MASDLDPTAADAPAPVRPRGPIRWGVCVTLLLAGCGGGDVGDAPGSGSGVPTAAQIAAAQAALDGAVPTDSSIAAKQAALDADADKDPE